MAERKTIIGLYANAPQSGKTEAANVLCNEYGFVVMKFASSLKAMVAALLSSTGVGTDLIHRALEGDLKEQPCSELAGHTPRHIMQTLGTEWGRGLHEDFWVNTLHARIQESNHTRIVVDDLRFPNEWRMLRIVRAKMVRIHRPAASYAGEHASEGALDGYPFDARVTNDGDLPRYHQKVRALASRLGLEPHPGPIISLPAPPKGAIYGPESKL